MVWDFLVSHWNDLLTVILAIVIAYYQIKNYRAQFADISIVDVDDPNYTVTSNVTGTVYEVTLTLENSGREAATISNITLNISNTDEQIDLENKSHRVGWSWENIQLSGPERRTVDLNALGDVQEGYSKPITGIIRMDTTAGEVEETITFEPR